MKSAVVNKETTIVENIIMADPNDIWNDANTYLVLVPDNLPVNIGNTCINNIFYNENNIIVEPIIEEIIQEEIINGS
jgi:hypothetical protein